MAGAFALALALVATAATIRPFGWDITALPRVGMDTPLAQAAHDVDPSFRTVRRPGYDGQFNWAIAVDPLARTAVHRAVDKPSYRYGHPLLGWVGWALSGGQAGAVAAALLVAGLLSFAAAAALAALLAVRYGVRTTAALFVVVNAGLLYAAVHGLVEPLATALVLGVLIAVGDDRIRLAAGLCVFLPLAKEQLILVPLLLAGWELRERRAFDRVALYAASTLPSIAWWIAMRVHLGAWFTTGDSALGAPFAGWKRAVLDAGVNAASGRDETTLVVLVGLGGLLACAGVAALRLRGPGALLFLAFLLIAICLADNATVILRDALRNTAVLVALVPFVAGQDARPRRTSAAVASSTRSSAG